MECDWYSGVHQVQSKYNEQYIGVPKRDLKVIISETITDVENENLGSGLF